MLLLWNCAAFAQQSTVSAAVHVRGSPILLEMAQWMAEAYMHENPKSTIAISGGGTYRGYKSILDGTSDVAMVASEPQDEVRSLMGPNSPKLSRQLVGYAAAVPVVHIGNPVNTLTMAQLRDVFSGRITQWKELGGKPIPIHVYVGLPAEGLTETWKQVVMGNDFPFTPKGQVGDTKWRMQKVALEPGAISFVAQNVERSGSKVLHVNGVAASVQTVQSLRYPLAFPLYLVTRDPASAVTQSFVRYFSAPNKRHRFDGIVTAETRE